MLLPLRDEALPEEERPRQKRREEGLEPSGHPGCGSVRERERERGGGARPVGEAVVGL